MGGDEAVVRFRFEADPCLYDSGRMFAIGYQRNKKEPNCVENMIFDSKDNVHGALGALLQVYPDFVLELPPFTIRRRASPSRPSAGSSQRLSLKT